MPPSRRHRLASRSAAGCPLRAASCPPLAGDALDDPDAVGFDAAFAVLFLALAAPYLREGRALQAAALAAAITLVLLPVAPAGVPIVAASAACLLGLRR